MLPSMHVEILVLGGCKVRKKPFFYVLLPSISFYHIMALAMVISTCRQTTEWEGGSEAAAAIGGY